MDKIYRILGKRGRITIVASTVWSVSTLTP